MKEAITVMLGALVFVLILVTLLSATSSFTRNPNYDKCLTACYSVGLSLVKVRDDSCVCGGSGALREVNND